MSRDPRLSPGRALLARVPLSITTTVGSRELRQVADGVDRHFAQRVRRGPWLPRGGGGSSRFGSGRRGRAVGPRLMPTPGSECTSRTKYSNMTDSNVPSDS
jgi:hypothetical protein